MSLVQQESKTHEVNIIVDWSKPQQKKVVRSIADTNIAINIFEPSALRQVVEKAAEPCPIILPFANMRDDQVKSVVDSNEIFVRKEALPSKKSAKLFLIFVSSKSLGNVLASLEKTILWCPQKVEMGLFHKDSHFITVLDNEEDDLKTMYGNEAVTRNRFVAAIVLGDQRAKITNHNPYFKTNILPEKVSHLQDYQCWQQECVKDLYFFPDKLEGHVLKLVGVPFAHLIQAEFLTEDQGSRSFHRLGNPRGLILDIMDTFEYALGVKVEFFNAEPVFEYGKIDPNGSWTGVLGMVHEDDVDFTLDWSLNYDVHQPFDTIVYGHQEYVTFASPKNVPASKILTIAYPFTDPVWIAIIISYVATPIAIYIIFSLLEDKLNLDWYPLFELYWYYFGVLMGEIKPNTVRINYLMLVHLTHK